MVTLFDFIKAEQEQAPLALGGPQNSKPQLRFVGDIVSGIAGIWADGGALSSNEAERFGKHVAELVSSDDFLKALSGKIQQPRPGETKEAFVQRCNEEMSALIKDKLNAK